MDEITTETQSTQSQSTERFKRIRPWRSRRVAQATPKKSKTGFL